ncbi:helix-turn-helix transcriptional regulator [Gordonia sp. DT30]|uniref:helix-turn-helix transcriptional regulator n=1 Tax=Gordonia sp. DT30 TaxID=3416546 RepID=UPI003CF4D364
MPTSSAAGLLAGQIAADLSAPGPHTGLLIASGSTGRPVLDALAAHAGATGRGVLRPAPHARDSRAEDSRPYSALRRLVDQLLTAASAITDDQRTALRVAFGVELGAEPTRLMLCTTILTLLRGWGADHPGGLLLVDEATKLEKASAQILAFVLRRIGHTGVGALVSAAPGDELFDDRIAEYVWVLENTGSADTLGVDEIGTDRPAADADGLARIVADSFRAFAGGAPSDQLHADLRAALTGAPGRAGAEAIDDAMWLLCVTEQLAGDTTPSDLRAVADALPVRPHWARLAGRVNGDAALGHSALAAEADRMVDDLAVASDPTMMVRTAFVTQARYHRFWWRDALVRVLSDANASPDDTLAAAALLAAERLTAGDWDAAGTLSARVRAIADAQGHRMIGTEWADYTAALLTAYRGEHDVLEAAISRMLRRDGTRGIFLTRRAAHARAALALGSGAPRRAYRLLGDVTPESGYAALVDVDSRMVLDLAQAAVGANAGDDVAALTEVLSRDESEAPLGVLEPLLTAGALAVVTGERVHYERALALPDADRQPFALARIRLSYGAALRSRGDRVPARHQLRSAASIFRGLKATPWLERTHEELRRLGDPSAAKPVRGRLTPIGHRVAELAASGLSNRQIGELLHLSASTVGTHLSSVYATLGVTSRAALRDSLSRLRL